MSHFISIMEQIQRLKNGVGIQSLLDSACAILGNPIALFNTEYNLLAYTETTTDDPIWNELITYGTFSKETQQLFDSEGFIEDLANAPRVSVMVSDKLKYDRMTGKIFNKNNSYVSNLVTVACNRPLEESDPLVFEAICKLISKEISRSESYQAYEQAHQETIIKSLIDGNCDRKLDLAQVEIIYASLESNLYLAVVDLSQHSPDCTNIVSFRDLFMQIEPGYKYAIYSDYIVIIISTKDEVLQVGKALEKLKKVFDQNAMSVGISNRFENLFELQKHYAEALVAMQYVLESKCDQRIFPYHERSTEQMEQIQQLKNGKGIQYFLNRGAEIFGNPLLFHDMELNLLGYTEHMEISDPIWQELITYGSSSNETVELFRTEGFIEMMDNTKGGALLVSDKIKYDRISWRIYNSDDIRIGCTSIVNTMRPFSEDELVLFGAFSQKFSKEVGKIEFYSNYGQVYSGTVINRLISGKVDDYTFYSEDIGNLYDHLMDHLYLLVIDTAQSDPAQINLAFFRTLFNQADTVNRYAIYSNHIIVIISTNSPMIDEKSSLAEINKIFAQHGIYAGISSRFENIYELQKHYNDAVQALRTGLCRQKPGSGRRIFEYEEADAR